jgi:hypothetical protein
MEGTYFCKVLNSHHIDNAVIAETTGGHNGVINRQHTQGLVLQIAMIYVETLYIKFSLGEWRLRQAQVGSGLTRDCKC